MALTVIKPGMDTLAVIIEGVEEYALPDPKPRLRPSGRTCRGKHSSNAQVRFEPG